MEIQLFNRKNIDDTKWNACIDGTINGMPYAYSWYLDIVCEEQWVALVWEDYKAVMPLPYNLKLLGLKQIYQPFFVQQLGLFSNHEISAELLDNFLNAIPTTFKKFSYHLNEGNPLITSSTIAFHPKSNYLLSLKDSYENIYANFATLQKRNIKKAKKNQLQITTIEVDAFIHFYKSNPTNKNLPLDDALIDKLTRLLNTIQTHKKGYPIAIKTIEGRICAACFLLKSHQRIIYFLARSNEEGRTSRAMPLLINFIIEENATTDLKIDFEGSSVASIAEFFRRFGAKEQVFYKVEYNHLPKWMRFLGK